MTGGCLGLLPTPPNCLQNGINWIAVGFILKMKTCLLEIHPNYKCLPVTINEAGYTGMVIRVQLCAQAQGDWTPVCLSDALWLKHIRELCPAVQLLNSQVSLAQKSGTQEEAERVGERKCLTAVAFPSEPNLSSSQWGAPCGEGSGKLCEALLYAVHRARGGSEQAFLETFKNGRLQGNNKFRSLIPYPLIYHSKDTVPGTEYLCIYPSY